MTDVSFNKTGAELTNEEVVYICRALKANHLRLLCLRECKLGKKDFHSILKAIGSCQSLQQLTLNVGIINNLKQVELLAKCIHKNTSLTGLHIHGSELGDVGLQILGKAIGIHPGIVSLDFGDCKLSDMSIDTLYSLMLPVNNRPGVTELTLSDNPRISALGWTQFSMCLANCNSLRWLFLDYNPLGDYAASCILTGIAASQSVEILDMEGCGLTEHTGQVLLHLVQNHLGSLSRIKVSSNRIRKNTVLAIRKHLSENHLDDSDTDSSITYEDLFDSESSASKKHHSSSSSTSASSSDSSSSSSSSSSSESDTEESDDDNKQKKGKKSKSKKDKKMKKTRDKQFEQTVIRGLTSHNSESKNEKGSADAKSKDKNKKKNASKSLEETHKKSKKDKNSTLTVDHAEVKDAKKKKKKEKFPEEEKDKDEKSNKKKTGDKKKISDEEDTENDSLGEELKEVPVFYK